MASCICDGGAYEVNDNPFIVNDECEIHGEPEQFHCYLCGRIGDSRCRS